jgi:hypothetical protein
MKNFIKKYWILIGMIVAFTLEYTFDILNGFGLSALQIKFVEGLGALIYGYFFTSKYNAKKISK